MDASAAPGVTAAEPGGLESREMIAIADLIGRRGGVSVIDVTELCPIYDVSGTTARLAVCTVLRIMAAMARQRGDVVDQTIKREALAG
jgi:arginase family enzyme